MIIQTFSRVSVAVVAIQVLAIRHPLLIAPRVSVGVVAIKAIITHAPIVPLDVGQIVFIEISITAIALTTIILKQPARVLTVRTVPANNQVIAMNLDVAVFPIEVRAHKLPVVPVHTQLLAFQHMIAVLITRQLKGSAKRRTISIVIVRPVHTVIRLRLSIDDRTGSNQFLVVLRFEVTVISLPRHHDKGQG